MVYKRVRDRTSGRILPELIYTGNALTISELKIYVQDYFERDDDKRLLSIVEDFCNSCYTKFKSRHAMHQVVQTFCSEKNMGKNSAHPVNKG